ncbi:unnamed protein product [Zymoseptoria tritici ST99CH_1E4]|uniref:F-box domain-containing protein n=1 Tax=Zymoseptoria tritici ST99CH_1E4 TaxID=1276532 RepID=A0A2H1H9D4_ZYMTR|nr:unnamed protein product [Zymoseptoria tritici ST99CH_1E4]
MQPFDLEHEAHWCALLFGQHLADILADALSDTFADALSDTFADALSDTSAGILSDTLADNLHRVLAHNHTSDTVRLIMPRKMVKKQAELVKRVQHPVSKDTLGRAIPPKRVNKKMKLVKSPQDQISSDSSSGRTTTDSRLLALPPELRNQIFRDVVKYDYKHIIVTPQGYDRPPLLETCKMIRKDALKLFYYTNEFYGYIFEYDYTPIAKFFALREANNIRTYVYFTLELQGVPNWNNLVDWVKREHGAKFSPIKGIPEREGNEVRIILRGFFAMAIAMRGQEWEEVEARLHAARPALIALDRNWALKRCRDKEWKGKAKLPTGSGHWL